MKWSYIYLLILATTPCKAQNKQLITALNNNVHILNTTDTTQVNDDLFFLKDLLKNKTIIGLGEATHGTKEFFTMKHRLLRFLVEEMGYRIFAIEASQPECIAINEYVMYGKGKPEEALMGIYFWTWNTNEILDMIKWMRAYNEGKADSKKVKFYGFDMQYTIAAAKFIKKDLDIMHINYSSYKYCLDSLSQPTYKLYEQDSSTLIQLYQIVNMLNDSSALYKYVYIKEKGDIAYQSHLQHFNILLQCISRSMSTNNSFRDSCMAENIKWISNHENTDKIVIWAHNAHISKTKPYVGYEGYQMGYWLTKLFNNKYYAIAFDFHNGGFRAKEDSWAYKNNMKGSKAPRVVNRSIKIRMKGSTDYIFNKTGIPLFYLDYNTATSNNIINNFLSTPINTKIIGAIFEPKWEKSYYHKIIPKEYYDAIIFVHTTTPTIPTAYYSDYINQKLDNNND